jgi:hypothetical protein
MALLKLLAFYQSRKVAFGLWLFIVSNVYLWFKVIQSNDWMTCIALSTALIGGGTVADRFLEAKKPSSGQ